jgi:hypothetical protein
MTDTATAHSHRVFEVIQGLWPVTFANVREADPEGLLDLFSGSDSTRDAYFEVILYRSYNAASAGDHWACSLQYRDTDHEDECENNSNAYKHSTDCSCKHHQWLSNQRWGQELYAAIQQRIQELNG